MRYLPLDAENILSKDRPIKIICFIKRWRKWQYTHEVKTIKIKIRIMTMKKD